MNRGQAGDLIGRAALSAHQKLILLAYMSHLPSDRPVGEGVAWPGLSTLCVWASCSRSTAQAARAELLTAGLLVAVERGEQAMRCRIDTEALAAWPAGERPAQRERVPALVEDGGCRQSAPLPDTGTPAGVRHRGVPPTGIGGAASRQGGVPVIGTEPSSDNPPHQPSTNNPPQLLSAPPPAAGAAELPLVGEQVEERRKPRRPTAAERAQAEAVALFERLEALRRTRHAGGRGLSPASWVPKVKTALTKAPAQDYIDALVWALHDPAAAFHRGEDQRSLGPDRTVDLSLVLRHPEYALRRSWWGAQAPTPEELAEAEAAHAEGQAPPAWVERRGASPMGRRAAQDAERKRREDDEARAWLRANTGAGLVIDDDDVCF